MNRLVLIAAVGSTLGITSLVDHGTAEAGRYRFGGAGRVHVRVPGVNVRFSRPVIQARASFSFGGHIRIGGGFRNRAYRPYYYTPIPSYYGYSAVSYYPVAPVATTAVVAVVPRPPLPRFGVGLFAGGVVVEDQSESSDVGILGRFRLTPGLLIEGEVGKMSYENDLRVDRRLGASLVYELGAYNKLAPYVLAGVGVQQADVADRYETTQNYAEVGIGLRYALTPHVHVAFDIRAGSRVSGATEDTTPGIGGVSDKSVVSPPSSEEGEEFSRARLSAMFYF